MQATPTSLALVLAVGCSAFATARAQSSDQVPARPGADGAATAAPAVPPVTPAVTAAVNVGQLPLNLARIQRRLKASAEREAHDGLRLTYSVDVFALAPPIVLFSKQDDLLSGPVPYGAPTTQQMLQALTPRGMAPPPTGRIQRRSKKR